MKEDSQRMEVRIDAAHTELKEDNVGLGKRTGKFGNKVSRLSDKMAKLHGTLSMIKAVLVGQTKVPVAEGEEAMA